MAGVTPLDDLVHLSCPLAVEDVVQVGETWWMNLAWDVAGVRRQAGGMNLCSDRFAECDQLYALCPTLSAVHYPGEPDVNETGWAPGCQEVLR